MDEITLMTAEISRILGLPTKRAMDDALLALLVRVQTAALSSPNKQVSRGAQPTPNSQHL